ncbi:hypothetical protein TURU_133785 [Turdus rufiventris]|nr:hypothetical protein TURU_133785 [Turdus rufiventris]
MEEKIWFMNFPRAADAAAQMGRDGKERQTQTFRQAVPLPQQDSEEHQSGTAGMSRNPAVVGEICQKLHGCSWNCGTSQGPAAEEKQKKSPGWVVVGEMKFFSFKLQVRPSSTKVLRESQ